MNANRRNTQIIVALIASMTLGAALLLWLESPMPVAGAPLIAREGEAVASLTLGVVSNVDDPAMGSYESYITPDGACHWRQIGANVHIAVVADLDQPLSETQSVMVLQMIRALHRERGLDLGGVTLSAEDTPSTSRMAQDLRELLHRKGLIP